MSIGTSPHNMIVTRALQLDGELIKPWSRKEVRVMVVLGNEGRVKDEDRNQDCLLSKSCQSICH